MPREPRPWFRKSADAWYVTVAGKQHRLARGKENKAEAVRAFHRLMVARGESDGAGGKAGEIKVAMLFDLLLDHVRAHNAASTYATYRKVLGTFADLFGDLKAAEVRPLHVARWLDQAGANWGDSYRFLTIAILKRVFTWGEEQGYLDVDPIRRLKKPRMGVRKRILTEEELARLFVAIEDDDPFRDFLTALVESGCRPGEAAKVEARDVDLTAGCWRVPFKRNPDRRVYMSPKLEEITRRLMAAHPAGPIFRNTRGEPWTRGAYGDRMVRLRRKVGLGRDVVIYSVRHTFATHALMGGTPIATVAALMGHKNTNMVAKIYSKLSEQHDHLREAARSIRAGATGSDGRAEGPGQGASPPSPPGTPPAHLPGSRSGRDPGPRGDT